MEYNSSEPPSSTEAWEVMPSYSKVAYDMLEIYKRAYVRCQESPYRFVRDFPKDVEILFNFTHMDLALLLSLVIGFTVLRTVLTNTLLLPLGRYLALSEGNVSKLPESVWKLSYYGMVSIYTFRIVVGSGRYRFFQSPSTVWDGWSADAVIPTDIYALYIVQGAFYLHGLYALFFQDSWRKDSVMMGVHHVLTIFLLWMSFACRYHNIGSLVMLFHDFCDVELEFAKLNVYLKVRGGQTHKLNDILAAVSFFAMTVTWFVCRLYYFPLKVLHAVSGVLLERDFIPDYTLLNNSMLLVLMTMNICWFSQMLTLLYKIVSGELAEFDDLREYDVVEKLERNPRKKKPKKLD